MEQVGKWWSRDLRSDISKLSKNFIGGTVGVDSFVSTCWALELSESCREGWKVKRKSAPVGFSGIGKPEPHPKNGKPNDDAASSRLMLFSMTLGAMDLSWSCG